MATNEAKLTTTCEEAGRRGGKARLTTMTPEERKRVARIAAEARWRKLKPMPIPPSPDGGGEPRKADDLPVIGQCRTGRRKPASTVSHNRALRAAA